MFASKYFAPKYFSKRYFAEHLVIDWISILPAVPTEVPPLELVSLLSQIQTLVAPSLNYELQISLLEQVKTIQLPNLRLRINIPVLEQIQTIKSSSDWISELPPVPTEVPPLEAITLLSQTQTVQTPSIKYILQIPSISHTQTIQTVNIRISLPILLLSQVQTILVPKCSLNTHISILNQIGAFQEPRLEYDLHAPVLDSSQTIQVPTLAVQGLIIYGNPIGMASLSNTPLKGYDYDGGNTLCSNRIMFPRSGNIVSVKKYWTGREGYGDGSRGSVMCQLQSDDESTDHFPSGDVLGETDTLSAEPATETAYFPVLTFTSPVTITAGVWYHLVSQNVDDDPNTNWVSEDDLYSGSDLRRHAPTIPDEQFAILAAYPPFTGWSVEGGMLAVVDFTYSDGTHFGQGYCEAGSTAAGGGYGHIVSGSNKVRERFTVSCDTQTYSKLYVRVLRKSGNDPLIVKIDGQTVTTNDAVLNGYGTGWSDFADAMFVSVDLPITLVNGNTYYLSLSCVYTTTYLIPAILDGKAGGYGFDASTVFDDGRAQYSTDNGTTWINWDTWGTPSTNQDLSFYFTGELVAGTQVPLLSQIQTLLSPLLKYTLQIVSLSQVEAILVPSLQLRIYIPLSGQVQSIKFPYIKLLDHVPLLSQEQTTPISSLKYMLQSVLLVQTETIVNPLLQFKGHVPLLSQGQSISTLSLRYELQIALLSNIETIVVSSLQFKIRIPLLESLQTIRAPSLTVDWISTLPPVPTEVPPLEPVPSLPQVQTELTPSLRSLVHIPTLVEIQSALISGVSCRISVPLLVQGQIAIVPKLQLDVHATLLNLVQTIPLLSIEGEQSNVLSISQELLLPTIRFGYHVPSLTQNQTIWGQSLRLDSHISLLIQVQTASVPSLTLHYHPQLLVNSQNLWPQSLKSLYQLPLLSQLQTLQASHLTLQLRIPVSAESQVIKLPALLGIHFVSSDADTAVLVPGQLITASVNAAIAHSLLATLNTDGVIQRALTIVLSSDVSVRNSFTGTSAVDVTVALTRVDTAQTDGVILRRVSSTLISDTSVYKSFRANVLVDGLVFTFNPFLLPAVGKFMVNSGIEVRECEISVESRTVARRRTRV